MLSGSALLRVLLLMAVAGAVIGLTRPFWSDAAVPPDRPAVAAWSSPPGATARRAEVPVTPRAAEPVATPAAPAAQPVAPAAPDSRGAAVEPQSLFGAPPTAPGVPMPAVAPVSTPAPRTLAAADQEIALADETAQPRAVDLVDLNSGSLAALNGLRGAGSVGRTIIQHRPYATVDQLLSKRVLSRALYQRVKDQVTVR